MSIVCWRSHSPQHVLQISAMMRAPIGPGNGGRSKPARCWLQREQVTSGMETPLRDTRRLCESHGRRRCRIVRYHITPSRRARTPPSRGRKLQAAGYATTREGIRRPPACASYRASWAATAGGAARTTDSGGGNLNLAGRGLAANRSTRPALASRTAGSNVRRSC